MRILNLYAGIGGNRKLWGEDHEVVAVEHDENIAKAYQDNFINDQVVVGDAHQFLLDHFNEFDFIWASPPCQSHSNFRQNINVRFRGTKPVYPDMKLYQEIIFLKHNFNGLWVVENVKPYYKPLIEPNAFIKRHNFWSNFEIPPLEVKFKNHRDLFKISELEQLHGLKIASYKEIKNKRQVLRNCVYPDIGRWVFDAMLKGSHEQKIN